MLHQHEIDIEGVVPGPEIIVLEGMVDGATLNIDLNAPVLLARLAMTREEFQEKVWGTEPQPELEENLRGILAYFYHLAQAEEGECHE